MSVDVAYVDGGIGVPRDSSSSSSGAVDEAGRVNFVHFETDDADGQRGAQDPITLLFRCVYFIPLLVAKNIAVLISAWMAEQARSL